MAIFAKQWQAAAPDTVTLTGTASPASCWWPCWWPDPDHHRGFAVRDRHRRHGPAGAAQRAGDVGPRGRGGRRREHAAARQDRHDHPRQPSGHRVPAGRRRDPPRSWPTPRSCPAWPTRRPRVGRSSCWPRTRTGCGSADEGVMPHAHFVPFTAETRMSGVDLTIDGGGPADPQGCRRRGHEVGARPRRASHRRGRPDGRRHQRHRRHAAGGGRARRRPACAGIGRRPPEGRRQDRACASGSTRCARWASAR